MFDWYDRYDAGGDGYLDLEELKVLLTFRRKIERPSWESYSLSFQ